MFTIGVGAEPTNERPVRVSVRLLETAEVRESCVEWEDVARAIEATLERPVFTSSDADLEISVRVFPDSAAAELELRNLAGQGSLGTRRVEARDCDELHEALVLAGSLMLDVRTRREKLESPTSGTASRSADAPSASAPSDRDEQPKRADRDGAHEHDSESLESEGALRWRLGIQGATGWGALPGPAFGIGLWGGVDLVNHAELLWSLTRWDAPSVKRVDGTAEVNATALALGLCGRFGAVLSPCVRTRWAVVEAAGRGFEVDAETRGLSGDVGVEAVWELELNAWRVRAAAVGAWNVHRVRLVVDAEDARRAVFEGARASLELVLGIGRAFGEPARDP